MVHPSPGERHYMEQAELRRRREADLAERARWNSLTPEQRRQESKAIEAASEVRAQAAAHARKALPQAEERLRQAMAAFPKKAEALTPHLALEHLVHGDALKGLKVGDPCPEHGVKCRVAYLSKRPGLLKRPFSARYQMDAWAIRANYGIQVWGSDEILEEPQRLGYGLLEGVLISIDGQLVRDSSLKIPVGAPSRIGDRSLIDKDDPDLLQRIGGPSRADMTIADYVQDLVEQIERLTVEVG